MLSYSQTHHLGTSYVETMSPVVNLEFCDEDSFRFWLKNKIEIEIETVEWHLTKMTCTSNSASNSSESPTAKITK